MKWLKCLYLLAAILTSQASQSQISSADTMVYRIIAALKHKDAQAFMRLFPDAEQSVRFAKKALQKQRALLQEFNHVNSSLGNGGKPMNIDSLTSVEIEKLSSPEGAAMIEKTYVAYFDTIISRGERKGLNWTNIELKKYQLDTVPIPASMIGLSDSTYKRVQGDIYFFDGKAVYRLHLYNALFIPEEGGWSAPALSGPVGENEKIEDIVETREITLESIQEEEPPPPPLRPKSGLKKKLPVKHKSKS